MKFPVLLLPALASCATLLSPIAVSAQAPPAPNFAAVAQHLETGGVFYTVVDIDGDPAKFGSIGDSLLEMVREDAAGVLPPGLSASGILKSLGLERIKALGMSSKAATGNLFHNRALVYMPEGRSGLFKLFGGPSTPLQSPALAPAGSDVVMESELTLSTLLETAEALLRSTGDEGMLQQYRGALGMPMPGGLEMTLGDLISKLDTRIIVAGRLEPDKSFTPPGEKFTLPGFRLVISFDRLGFLASPLVTYAKHSADMTLETGDGFEMIQPKKLPADVPGFLKPLFYHDIKTQRLLLASHPDALQEFLANKSSVSSDPAFVKAMAGLPADGNEFAYLTPAVYAAFKDFFSRIMDSAPSSPGGPDRELIKKIMGLFDDFSPAPTQPVISLRRNLPEGMLFLSTSPNSFKSILTLPPAFFTAAMVAGGFKGYNQVRTSLEAKRAESEKLENADSDASHDDIRNNLQQITFAAQSYFVDRPEAAEVSYEQLIASELLLTLDPVGGESYKGLKLKKTGGVLTLKLPGGGTVTQKYSPVTD